MKIGIRLDSHRRWGEKRYEKLKEHGFSCIDFNMMSTTNFPYSDPLKETENTLIAERKLAEQSNIEIYQVHGPWEWPPPDNTEQLLNEKIENVKRSLWATAVLGCKNWVIHPVMPCGISEKGTEDQKTTLDVNLSFMQKILEVAKQYDITICLENMPMQSFSLATPYEILDFTNLMNDEHFKICLDTGHVATFPDLSASKAVRDLGDKIQAFHIHDSFPDRDLHLFPYFGVTNWADFSCALKEINYNGGLCLETAPPHVLPDEVYEDLCVNLFKIVKTIAND